METKEFENQLKARRKAFGETLESYAQEVEGFSHKSDMVRRDQVAAEVTELNEKLKAAQAEAEAINAQEKMLGWAATKYNNVAKVWSLMEASGFHLPLNYSLLLAAVSLRPLSDTQLPLFFTPRSDDLCSGALHHPVDHRQSILRQVLLLDERPLHPPQPRGS